MTDEIRNDNLINETECETRADNAQNEVVIEIRHLGKSFGDHEVLKDIDFTVRRGDVTCIIGASGSGKSTLLRCINLFESPSSGEILLNGENVVNTKNPAEFRKKVGMVFQSFNLFKNMNVLKNCTVGPRKVLKLSKEESEARARKYLRLVGMEAYVDARPGQLSGGQIQLVDVLEFHDKNVADEVTKREQMKKICTFMNDVLSEREAFIIRRRYGIGGNQELTQREIARALGISRSYVSRIEKRALEKLKKVISE